MQNGPVSSTRIGEGSILTLERIERHQAGIYQCSADNGVGEPVTMEMKLDILCEYSNILVIIIDIIVVVRCHHFRELSLWVCGG